MKAGVVHATNDIRYEEIDKPKADPGKVVVKVKYTGICGSDIPRVNADACHFFPNVLGHEFSGIVDEVGEGVTLVKKGDRVAGVPLVPCLKCPDCQRGDYSLCKHYSFIGSREFGSFAEYVSMPELNVVKFGDDVSFEKGAFFEPATVALHGLRRVDYKGGKNVAILGGGGAYKYVNAMKEGQDIYLNHNVPHHIRRDVISYHYNLLEVNHEVEKIFCYQMKKLIEEIDPSINCIIVDHEELPELIH